MIDGTYQAAVQVRSQVERTAQVAAQVRRQQESIYSVGMQTRSVFDGVFSLGSQVLAAMDHTWSIAVQVVGEGGPHISAIQQNRGVGGIRGAHYGGGGIGLSSQANSGIKTEDRS